MRKEGFQKILYMLSLQKGEEKLRLAFELNYFVRKLQKEGERYAKKRATARSRAAA